MKEKRNLSKQDLNQLLRELLSQTIGKLPEAELEEFLGYKKHKRSDNPSSRNGYYPKSLKSHLGELQINVPRDRLSEFNPKSPQKAPNPSWKTFRTSSCSFTQKISPQETSNPY